MSAPSRPGGTENAITSLPNDIDLSHIPTGEAYVDARQSRANRLRESRTTVIPFRTTVIFCALLASGALVLFLSGVGFAQGFSGYEAFVGVPNSAGTGKNDNLFAGWTDSAAIANGWQKPTQSNNQGGIAAGSVNYIGKPGFRRCVTICPAAPGINGDEWSWVSAGAVSGGHSGPVEGGFVVWPSSARKKVSGSGCPGGVAALEADIQDENGHVGVICGCLNDQLTIPPKIWGQIDIDGIGGDCSSFPDLSCSQTCP